MIRCVGGRLQLQFDVCSTNGAMPARDTWYRAYVAAKHRHMLMLCSSFVSLFPLSVPPTHTHTHTHSLHMLHAHCTHCTQGADSVKRASFHRMQEREAELKWELDRGAGDKSRARTGSFGKLLESPEKDNSSAGAGASSTSPSPGSIFEELSKLTVAGDEAGDEGCPPSATAVLPLPSLPSGDGSHHPVLDYADVRSTLIPFQHSQADGTQRAPAVAAPLSKEGPPAASAASAVPADLSDGAAGNTVRAVCMCMRAERKEGKDNVGRNET